MSMPYFKMNKKGVEYSLIMLFTVMVALSVLYWRISETGKIKEEYLGASQIAILTAPYEKANIIRYAEISAEKEISQILRDITAENGYAIDPPGGTYIDACTIINTNSELKTINKPNVQKAITAAFNARLNPYLNTYNTKVSNIFPLDNYEIVIEDDKINAIALMPIQKPLQTHAITITGERMYGIAVPTTEALKEKSGTMWFAPSFTISYPHKLNEYSKVFDILGLIVEKCAKKPDAMNCVETYKDSMTGWTWKQEGDLILFNVPSAHGTLCYAMKTATPTP